MCDRARRQKRVSASFFADAVLVPLAVCVGPAACPAGLVDRRTVCLPAPCGAPGGPTEDAGRPGTRIRGPLVGRRCARYTVRT
jgi:hypothetical protein